MLSWFCSASIRGVRLGVLGSGTAPLAVASQTIVRKVGHERFVLIHESEAYGHFVFAPAGPSMTLHDVCNALIGQGISEDDAQKLLHEAEADFNRK